MRDKCGHYSSVVFRRNTDFSHKRVVMYLILNVLAIIGLYVGYNDAAHDDDISLCSANCKQGCDAITKTCLVCFNGWYGDKCDSPCVKNCETCKKNSGSCIYCEHGWFGDTCSIPCEKGCISCEKGTGHCLKCLPTFWGESCAENCKVNCQTCNIDTGECKSCVAGFYGENCTKECGNCQQKTCGSVSGECVYECQEGWFGPMCDKQCTSNCSACSDSIACITCKTGLAGKQCDLQCPDVCHSCVLDKVTKKLVCTKCREGLSNPEKNCTCSRTKCSNFIDKGCNGCQRGYFLYRDTCCPCVNCLGGNQNCDNQFGCKNGCEPGFYPEYSGCDKQCDIDHCVRCQPSRQNGKICIHCENGWYPSSDTCKPCNPHCAGENNVCDNETGVCLHGCKTGWHSSYCDSKCNNSCITCDNENGICNMCDLGLWGQQCENRCRKNCKLCDISNGECEICDEGYQGPDCEEMCVNCNDEQCDDKTTGVCHHGCKSGWYGDKCFEKCVENCAECTSGTNCLDCVVGWTGSKCAQKCPDSCIGCFISNVTKGFVCKSCANGFETPQKSCSCTRAKCQQPVRDNEFCMQCEDKWFVYHGTCCPCSECNWSQSRCDDINKCPDECKVDDVTSNVKCSTICMQEKCTWCETNSEHNEICVGCEAGWHPFNGVCLPCSEHCAEHQGATCDSVTGACIHGCKTGWFRSMCNSTCNTHCQNCNEDNRTCVNCVDGYWGDDCNIPCQGHCKTCRENEVNCIDIEIILSCEKLTGNCTEGCRNGWYGSKCDTMCKRCKNGLCEQDSGTCINGCIDGWKGERCDISSTDESGIKFIPILGGAAGGGVLILAFIVICVCFWRSQKSSSSAQIHKRHKVRSGKYYGAA